MKKRAMTADTPGERAQEIGQRVAALRHEKGLSQQELAQRLGVAQSVVSDYERGILRLHGELLLELAEIFGATPNEVLGIEARPQRRGPQNQRLSRRLQEFEKLPRRDQEALLRTIDAFLSRAS